MRDFVGQGKCGALQTFYNEDSKSKHKLVLENGVAGAAQVLVDALAKITSEVIRGRQSAEDSVLFNTRKRKL